MASVPTTQDFRKFYYQYKKSCKILGFKPISRVEHRQLIIKFHKLMFNEILYNNYIYNMPAGLGTVYMMEYKAPTEYILDKETGNMKINPVLTRFIKWSETKKLWKEHPEKKGKEFKFFPKREKHFKFKWTPRPFSFKKCQYYKFRPVHQNRKIIGNFLNNNNTYEAYGSRFGY